MSNKNAIPLAYTTPAFPSLYWPFNVSPGDPAYLYTLSDIWRFTLYWTLITIPAAHFLVALWAILMQFLGAYRRSRVLARQDRQKTGGGGGNSSSSSMMSQASAKNRRLLGENPYRDTGRTALGILAVYLVIGGLEALMAGSLVGVVLGAVYNAGYFRMSVWTPLIWGIINMLVLIVASFRISGGL